MLSSLSSESQIHEPVGHAPDNTQSIPIPPVSSSPSAITVPSEIDDGFVEVKRLRKTKTHHRTPSRTELPVEPLASPGHKGSVFLALDDFEVVDDFDTPVKGDRYYQNLAHKKPFAPKRPPPKRVHKTTRPRKLDFQAMSYFDSVQPGHEVSPQDLLDQLSLFTRLTKYDVPPLLLKRIEDAVLHFYALCEINSDSGALALCLMYLKTFTNESLIATASAFFREFFEETELEVQSGIMSPDWLSALRGAHKNWQLLTQQTIFKKFSVLLSAAVTLGLCDASKLTWSVNGIRLFHVGVTDRILNSYDILDAVMDSVMFFVDGGHACFTSGSIAPLFFSDRKGLEMEDEYLFIMRNIEHVRTGNLHKLAGITDHELDKRLAALSDTYRELFAEAQSPWEKKFFRDRQSLLNRTRADFDAIRVQGGLRPAPYTVLFYGSSGVGKSSLCNISLFSLLKANNLPCGDEDVATINDNDKFMSNFKSCITGVIIDDIGNTKPDFVERAPTQKIIEICNNIRTYANVAEANMKGKVSIEPYVVHLTTNKKGLDATTYSNEPVSIVRRAHVTVTVRVKPQFATSDLAGFTGQMLDQQKVQKFYTVDGLCDIPVIPDLWELTLETVMPIPNIGGAPDSIGYTPVVHKGKQMVDVSIFEYLDYVIDDSRAYYVSQHDLVQRSNNLSHKLVLCKCCNKPLEVCSLTVQSGLADYFPADPSLALATAFVKMSLWNRFMKWTSMDAVTKLATTHLRETTTGAAIELLAWLETSPYTSWTSYIPDHWLQNSLCKNIARHSFASMVADDIVRIVRWCAVMFVVSIFMCFYDLTGFVFTFFLWVCLLFVLWFRTRIALAMLHAELVQRNDAMPAVVKRLRNDYTSKLLCGCAGLVALVFLYKMYKSVRQSSLVKQSALSPISEEEVDKRDATTNIWLRAATTSLPATQRARTMSLDEVQAVVARQTLNMTIHCELVNKVSNAFFISSNLAIIPNHVWSLVEGNDFIATFTKFELDRVGATFRSVISKTHSYHVPNTDLCYVSVPGGGSWKDISHLLPTGPLRDSPGVLLYKSPEGQLRTSSLHAHIGTTGPAGINYVGATYDLAWPTFVGMCMAPVVSKSSTHVIMGFHLAGAAGTSFGACGTLTLDEHNKAIAALSKIKTLLLVPSSGDLPTNILGVDHLLNTDIHPKSPVNFLEGSPNVEIYGTCVGSTSPRTSVVTSPISSLVEEVCGVAQLWGPPKMFPAWKGYQPNLQVSSQPAPGVEAYLIEKAADQFLKPLLKIASKDYWKKQLRPLTNLEVVCGIDGKKFVDRMNMATSVGYPLFKPKNDFVFPLDPTPECARPLDLDPCFWEQEKLFVETYARNERAYPVYNACLKDEPTKLSKDKVRVFQSAPLALQIIVRRYYLPIARFFAMNPLVSKMSVGINAVSPEWDELMAHVCKYGKDRILAGDYAKFDQRMPAQSILVACKIMIRIAEVAGYSEEDLNIMRCVAADIAYPLVNFNGTLIQFFGMHCSGENMTVFINCIQAIMNVYCFVLQAYPEANVDDVVAFTTYGDDSIGSVNANYPLVDHINFAQWLANRDQVFTMPDKTSDPLPYLRLEDTDFLKRKDYYHPDLECHVGALDEMSIFKSLHCLRSSKAITPEENVLQNVDGALREWFFHGREVFELRQAQMLTILSRCGYVSREAHVPFDARVAEWKSKYREGDYPVPSSAPILEIT